MARFVFSVSLALGAILVASNAASAGENIQSKVGATGSRAESATITLGGKGTAASAAAAADSELTCCRGYRRGYYCGYYGGLGGCYSGYYPYSYSYSYPSAYPYYYTPAYYPPVIGFGARFGPLRVGVYGINGTGSDVAAPAVALNLGGSTAQQPASPTNAQPGPYRYDGGPANPIPLPKQDLNSPNGQATPTLPANTGLPVSLNKTESKPAKPYTYKGYGEK